MIQNMRALPISNYRPMLVTGLKGKTNYSKEKRFWNELKSTTIYSPSTALLNFNTKDSNYSNPNRQVHLNPITLTIKFPISAFYVHEEVRVSNVGSAIANQKIHLISKPKSHTYKNSNCSYPNRQVHLYPNFNRKVPVSAFSTIVNQKIHHNYPQTQITKDPISPIPKRQVLGVKFHSEPYP